MRERSPGKAISRRNGNSAGAARTSGGKKRGTLAKGASAKPKPRAAGAKKSLAKSKRDKCPAARGCQSLAPTGDFYQLLFESSPRPTFVFDIESLKFLAVNQAAIDQYGYSRDEFLAMGLGDIRPPEDVPEVVRLAHTPIVGPRSATKRSRHLTKDGTLIKVEVSAADLFFQGRRARLSVAVDLTEQEKRLTALRESESRVRSILEAAQDAIVMADMDGRIVEFNAAAERLFGYSKAEALGRDLADTIIPPDMRAGHRRAIAHYVETGERHMIGHTAEMVGYRADGTEIPIEVTLSVRQAGAQHGFLASIRDLRDRKATETQVAVGIGVSRAMVEASTLEQAACASLRVICETLEWEVGAVWALDPNAQIMRLVSIWALPDADMGKFLDESRRHVFPRGAGLPGRTWERGGAVWIPDLCAEHGCTRLEAAKASCLRRAFAFPILADKQVQGVVEFFARDMREPEGRWLEIFGFMGGRLGTFIERHHIQERLQCLSRTLQSVLTAAPVAIIVLQEDLVVQYWNHAAERLFGWTEKEMIGLPYTLLVPEDRRREFRRNFESLLRGGVLAGVETCRLRKDGTKVAVSLFASPVFGKGGEVVGGVVMAADLSQRKRS